MDLVLVDKTNYKEAIKIQNSIFPKENGTLNILESLDKNLFVKNTGLECSEYTLKYYLARLNDKYIGITGVYYSNFCDAWLGWYGILKEYRNKGLGHILLDKTIELVLNNGFKNLRLYTDFIDNRVAIKLYKKKGFIGEKYTAERLPYDCRIYSKNLHGNEISLWNNKNLNLINQLKLESINEKNIKEIIKHYDDLFNI